MLITCHVCGKEVDKRGGARYCSPECKKTALNARIHPKTSKTCLYCSKEFIASRKDMIFCSEDCRRQHQYWKDPDSSRQQTKAWRMANRERWKELNDEYHNKTRYGGNRDKCFERDGYMCVRCGGKNQLVPHHKDGSGQAENPNHNLDNLETLCRKCHMAEHDPNPNKPNKITLECEYCKQQFQITPSRHANGRGRFCSRNCRKLAGYKQ